jgi:hypothetical protein
MGARTSNRGTRANRNRAGRDELFFTAAETDLGRIQNSSSMRHDC